MGWHHSHVLQARLLQHLVHPDVVIGHILQLLGHLGWVPEQESWGDRGQGQPRLEDSMARPTACVLCQDKTLQGLTTAFRLLQAETWELSLLPVFPS